LSLDVNDERAPNYLGWIAELISPFLGQSVLELGAGIGSITALYAPGRRVVATDVSEACIAGLTARFRDSREVTVAQLDLRALDESFGSFESVVMVNVLEHIEDDVGTLEKVQRVLTPDGSIVLYVPALNGLYGEWDRRVGHYRRYSKWRMREVAHEARLEIVELRYVNALAIPVWVAFSKSNAERTPDAGLSIWDRTGVPLSRALETRIRMPLGLNLLAALRRTG